MKEWKNYQQKMPSELPCIFSLNTDERVLSDGISGKNNNNRGKTIPSLLFGFLSCV